MGVIATVHRFLGEGMALVALAGVILAIVGLVRKRAQERPEEVFGMAYSGLLDLQVLLGIIYFFLLPAAARPTVLHPIVMVAALVIVHASRTWRRRPVPTRHWAQLGAYGASLALIIFGITLVM